MSMNQQFDAGLNIIESKQSVITQAFRTRLVLKLENYIILIYYGTFSNSTLRFGLIFVLTSTFKEHILVPWCVWCNNNIFGFGM